ncbi:helix-turn-helix domain-containing protein [Sinomicrobium pectinilyticum]|uniref:Helix-turn-helix domain-containing protein n=1 Tax=Sinomicrobium pectinilyticum TaxID=1084421 RepID=A0A3N0EEQ9_SINP1|nr:helix-turn-helix domain-containing protein [Sinomicrobium pectinilyticum]RNL86323.1 helix-turn-helix domain-containing protein [Sinomicrobium pectinilyticum]
MDPIKTYNDVDPADSRMTFRIRTMEDIYEEHSGKADEPHRHDYYIIVLVRRGKGTHSIDFTEYPLSDRQVYFISPGQVHRIVEKEKSRGYVITFSGRFMTENQIDSCFIDDINLFKDYGEAPPLPLAGQQLEQLSSYCEQMMEWNSKNMKFRSQGIGALLKLFLISCNNLCSLHGENPQQLHAGGTLLRDYKQLVEEHFTEWHLVSRYAEALHVTPDHLNRTVKSLIGKTAKEYLQSRITVAARRMLYFSGQPQKEIAYALGFSEPAHFSSFFKKCTGMSPSDFRR